MKNAIVIVCALTIFVFMIGRPARGDVLTASEANVIVSSTAFDQDLLFTSFTQSDDAVADFNGILNDSGWSGLFTGSFLGTALSVSYAGDSSAFADSGGITWNSGGLYGSKVWAGSGSVTFTSIDLNNITATYVSTLTIGADTISFADSLSGFENSATGLSVTASGIASLSISPNPPVQIDTLFVVERTRRDNDYVSIVRGGAVARAKDLAEQRERDRYHAQVASIPEPSSLLQLALGLSCLLGYLRLTTYRSKRYGASRANTRGHGPNVETPVPRGVHPFGFG
jgi:hypothetical protein